MKILRGASLCAALALAVLSLPTTALGAASSGGREKPTRGGVATYLFVADATSFDPATVADTTALVANSVFGAPIYDLLLVMDSRTGKISPGIATDLTSTDDRVWTLKLRPNVVFSDGTPYDAAAVKFNWDRYRDPALRSPLASVVAEMTTEVVDPLTLKITLDPPSPFFDLTVGGKLGYIGSPAAITEAGTAFGQTPVGAGPFMLKERVRDSHTTYVRNPNYWNKPRPYIDELTIRVIRDEAQRVNTWNTGEGTVMQLTSAAALPTVEDGKRERFVANGGAGLLMNSKKPPFDNRDLRRGFALAIDNQRLINVVDRGLNDPVDRLFAKESPFANDVRLNAPYNLKKAQRLINKYVANNGGEPITLDLVAATSATAYATELQTQLSRLNNVEVRLDLTELTQVVTRAIQGNYQLLWLGTTFNDPEPRAYQAWHCDGASNYFQYCNPKMDAALERAHATSDVSERKQAYREVSEIIRDDVPWKYIVRSYINIVVRPDVRGFASAVNGNPRFGEMWFDAK